MGTSIRRKKQRPPPQPLPERIVLLGAEGVGKTSLLRQIVDGQFDPHYTPTTVETVYHTTEWDGESHKLHFCDTSGAAAFRDHRAPYLSQASALLLVYSITNAESLVSLVDVAREAALGRKAYGTPRGLPILVVGTHAEDVLGRAVSTSEAERVAAACAAALHPKPPNPHTLAAMSVLEVSCADSGDAGRVLRALLCVRFGQSLPTAAPPLPLRAAVLQEKGRIGEVENVSFSPKSLGITRSCSQSQTESEEHEGERGLGLEPMATPIPAFGQWDVYSSGSDYVCLAVLPPSRGEETMAPMDTALEESRASNEQHLNSKSTWFSLTCKECLCVVM